MIFNVAMKTNPLDEGYYYIVNNNKDYVRTHKNKIGIYTMPNYLIYNNSAACIYNTFDKNNANYIYKISLTKDSSYTIQNVYTSMYLSIDLNKAASIGVLEGSADVRKCNIVFNTPEGFQITNSAKSFCACLPASLIC